MRTLSSVTVEILAPGPWLAINDRSVWQVRWQRTRAWRSAASVAARASGGRGKTRPRLAGRIHVHATICKSHRIAYDLDGTAATVKACVDGLRDAGLIEADDSSTLTRLTITPGPLHPRGAVVLTITESED